MSSDGRGVSKDSMSNQPIFELPRVDDYFGDIGFFDDVCFYGKFSNGMFGSTFDEKTASPNKAEWKDVSRDNADDLKSCRNYFTGMIGAPVYGIRNVETLQQDKILNEVLKSKILNDWESVEVAQLRINKNQILSQLLGDGMEGDESDLWITCIAFGGYGSHRTMATPMDGKHQNAYFYSDVTWLDQYEVRPGYEKYGAAAWFDAHYRLKEIQLSHTGKIYKPPSQDGNKAEWEHAKWVWKVSLSVAIFLVDHLAHFQLRECSGMVKALRKLPEGHELRRLMLPFTYGVVQRARAMNEYLRENGLYHRAFAFTYSELQRLIRDAVSDAPEPTSSLRKKEDQMRYRWRLFKKRVRLNHKLVDQIHPLYTDGIDFWMQTLNFVTKYAEAYYGSNPKDDTKVVNDEDIREFYKCLMDNWKFPSKYRLKKFNVVNILAHFVCQATCWNNHLNGAVSFDYSVDPDFTGLKILGNNAKKNNIQNYAEYCCVVLSKGWQHSDLMKEDVWLQVLERMPKEHQKDLSKKTFKAYFQGSMQTLAHKISERNKQRVVPYRAMNPKNLQSSPSL